MNAPKSIAGIVGVCGLMVILTAGVALAHDAPPPVNPVWPRGMPTPEITFCFYDQDQHFYGLQLYTTPNTNNLIFWGHRHDASYGPYDPEFVQNFTGNGYYFPVENIANVSGRIVCLAPGCQSLDFQLMFDYSVEPWVAEGEARTDDGAQVPLTLTHLGFNWPGRSDCTAAHP